MSSEQSSPPDPIVAKPPPPVSTVPDENTRQYPAFHEGGAAGQVFHFTRWGLSYGTDDKGHAAALILSALLLVVLLVVILIGAAVDNNWISDALQIVGTSFTFVAGVAVGQSFGK